MKNSRTSKPPVRRVSAVILTTGILALLAASTHAQLMWDGPATTNNNVLDGSSGNWDHARIPSWTYALPEPWI